MALARRPARENAVLPLSEEEDTLRVIMSDPLDYDTREKLRFIMNRNIQVALAPREMIHALAQMVPSSPMSPIRR